MVLGLPDVEHALPEVVLLNHMCAADDRRMTEALSGLW